MAGEVVRRVSSRQLGTLLGSVRKRCAVSLHISKSKPNVIIARHAIRRAVALSPASLYAARGTGDGLSKSSVCAVASEWGGDAAAGLCNPNVARRRAGSAISQLVSLDDVVPILTASSHPRPDHDPLLAETSSLLRLLSLRPSSGHGTPAPALNRAAFLRSSPPRQPDPLRGLWRTGAVAVSELQPIGHSVRAGRQESGPTAFAGRRK